MEIIRKLCKQELDRQNNGIELIASENYVSRNVLQAAGSIFTNKYAEGYPGKRYYGGCEVIDKVEEYAQFLAKQLFNVKYVNVQPHSGSQANYAAYKALLPNGGTILSLELNDGGHLTHGSPVSFSSHDYTFIHYNLDKQTGKIDYDKLEELAISEKPNVILSGFSAYPYKINFVRIREICDKISCKMMVDMSHIAGLVAAKAIDNPCKYADIVTSTTHKTLRGPRGGIILTNDSDLYKKINSAVFPYSQGGPLEHIIAAKAVCFKEADTIDFRYYIQQVLENTKACCDTLKRYGAKVSTTETHLFLLDTYNTYGLTGLEAQKKLENVGITTNKNMIPGDTLKPNETSGLRIGLAAVTTRGCNIEDAIKIADLIHFVLSDSVAIAEAEIGVAKLVNRWRDISKL